MIRVSASEAVIFDVDGTLCDVSSARHFVRRPRRDFASFHRASRDCPPHGWVVDLARLHHAEGRVIAVVTARMYQWEQLTRDWLDEHLPVPYVGPFMRGDDDHRPDVEVKRDIYRILIEDHGLDIVQAVDDNPAIVELWEQLGIPVTVVEGWETPR